jgi:hypothetical protein
MIDFGAARKNGNTELFAPHERGRFATKDPFDVAPIKEKLAPYKKAVDEMAKEALAHTVTDEPSNDMAVDMGKQLQVLGKKIETLRVGTVEAPNAYVKTVNGLCKTFTDGSIKAGLTHLKRQAGDYQYRRQMAQREAEKKARDAAAELQKTLNVEAEEKGVEAPVVMAPVMPEETKVTRTEAGASSHVRKIWKHEVMDAALVPREYCQPVDKLIRQAVQGGLKEIPGVRIYPEAQAIIK